MIIKTSILLLAALSFASLAACTGPVIIAGAAGTSYLTGPWSPPPADTADQIPPHESWCYSTLGESVECYALPQDVPYDRLVMVDPPNRYPLTPQDYSDELAQSRAEQAAKLAAREAAKPPPPEAAVIVPPVQPAEMTPIPPPAAQPAPAPPTPPVHKHKKKPPATTANPPAPAAPAPTAPPPAISN